MGGQATGWFSAARRSLDLCFGYVTAHGTTRRATCPWSIFSAIVSIYRAPRAAGLLGLAPQILGTTASHRHRQPALPTMHPRRAPRQFSSSRSGQGTARSCA